ncbi:MAG TPA: hypothetical protein VG820_08225 [Fimbriimonadaceae bacterium]|nr:hypothetical protein [Fimbriimonadaceae bacterium]
MRRFAILLIALLAIGCGDKPKPAEPVTNSSSLPANAGGQQLSHP